MHIVLDKMQQRLVDTGFVQVVDKQSDEIPQEKRDIIRRGFSSNFVRKGLACTLLRDDGTVLVIVEGPPSSEVLRHEFIHVAQCFAASEQMASCLDAVRSEGRKLVAAIRRTVQLNPDTANDYRDMTSSERTWGIHVAGEAVTAPFNDFEFFMSLFPTPETIRLSETVLGQISKSGTFAAMTAAICDEIGFKIDPSSDMAREIVAYTFEGRSADVVDQLFENTALELERRVSALSFGR